MKVLGGKANDFELLHDYLKIIQTSEAVKFSAPKRFVLKYPMMVAS